MPATIISAPASGNIVAVSYDADAQTLFVQFLYQSALYEYQGISEDLANGFSTALSATQYLKQNVLPISTGQRVA
jgi:KTSC domain